MDVSVSRSVGRAFAVMEFFSARPRPATATDISRQLEWPHSSAVAILHGLVKLDYLTFDPRGCVFFPSDRLWGLAASLRLAQRKPTRFTPLVEDIARQTGHTVSLHCRTSIFLTTLLLRTGSDKDSIRIRGGVGVPLVHSVAGLAILSKMPEADVITIVRETMAWSTEAGARLPVSIDKLFETLADTRRSDVARGSHHALRDVNVAACRLDSPVDSSALAIAVSFPASSRINSLTILAKFQAACHAAATHDHAAPPLAPQPHHAPAWQKPQPHAFV